MVMLEKIIIILLIIKVEILFFQKLEMMLLGREYKIKRKILILEKVLIKLVIIKMD
jgi:hypothetical protein